MSPKTMRRLMVAAASPLVPLLLLAARPAPDRVRVGGTFTMTYSQRHTVPVADAEGHILLAGEAKGINRSTGPTAFMDAAEVTNVELTDLVQGNGTHQGYDMMTQNGQVKAGKWSGKITTVLGPDQQPVTTFEGTWVNVKGPAGRGTYKGRITGPDTYTVDWQGEVEQPLASR